MAAVISLKGIDEAITNLGYANPHTLKSRLISAIRSHYRAGRPVESVREIKSEDLIKLLWDVSDDTDVKKKRKNLSGVKSSLNTDLKKAYDEGGNPEGVIISPKNIFAMSDAAKDKIVSTMAGSIGPDSILHLTQLVDLLDSVHDTLLAGESESHGKGLDAFGDLDQLKEVVRSLSERLGVFGEVEGGKVEGEEAEELEEVDALDEVIEVIDDVDGDEVLEEVEGEKAEGLEEVDDVDEVIEEAEGLEDVDDVDEVVEDIEDLEDAEIVEDEEVLEEEVQDEIIELADDLEDTEVVEEVEGEEVEGDEADELEEVIEVIDDVDGDEVIEVIDEVVEANRRAEEFNRLLGDRDTFYNQYVHIPEGDYIVGSPAPTGHERPEQVVRLGPFRIGEFPITNALFEAFVQETGYRTVAERTGFGLVYKGRMQKVMDKNNCLVRFHFFPCITHDRVKGACWFQPEGPGSTIHQKRNHPVVQVTLEDAMAFTAWTGRRLPTEAEWEAATRTSKGYVLPWGNEWRKGCCNIDESCIADTTPVNKYRECAVISGVLDVMGNVLEWTCDSFEPRYSEGSSQRYCIAKGGSWISESDVRLFNRFPLTPDISSNILGFRSVLY